MGIESLSEAAEDNGNHALLVIAFSADETDQTRNTHLAATEQLRKHRLDATLLPIIHETELLCQIRIHLMQ